MLTIRRATAADATPMLALQRRAFVEEARRSGTEDIPPLTEPLASIAAHIERETAIVATLGDRIVGGVRGVVENRVATIRGLVVDPAHHGHGIGSKLLKALEAALPDVERIDLTTSTLMERNVPFYERHGYRVTEYTLPVPTIRLAQMSKAVAGRST